MKLIYHMWLGVHKYIYLIQSIYMGVVKHNWAFQKYFSILNLKYAKVGLSYDADFLHMCRLQQKQQIDTVILRGLQ